ncbi:MAG TPA: PAS domain S-box protein [Candidatus Eisenbacteria bacterium]|nr:PAS domain S-box protein [Candidatus Eisenbacteria bacterium]
MGERLSPVASPGELPTPASKRTTRAFPRAVSKVLLGLSAFALVTVVCFQLGLNSTPTAFFYLILIVLLSLVSDFIPLAALSILAVASLNYFFVPPRFSFAIENPVDAVELAAFFVTALVITRLVNRSTKAARLLEERARLLDLTHDAVFVRDMDRRIIYWNRGAEELYGWTADEALGQVAHELLHTRLPIPFADVEAELLRNGSWQGDIVHTTRDGKQVVVASRWGVERDESGDPVAFLETTNDITERRRSEEALRRSEDKWRAVFEHNPTMYFMIDPAGAVVSVNPFGAENLGYTVDELVGHPVLNLFLEADREAARRKVAACLEHPGQIMTWELRKVRKDGTMLWVRETAKAMRTAEGELAVLIVCEDITQQKRAEDELRASEGRFRTLVDHATDAFFLADERLATSPGETSWWRVIDVNREACDSLGYTRDELIGMNAIEVTPDLDADSIRKEFPPGGSNILTFETRLRRKDGTSFPVEVRTRRFSEHGHRFSISLVRDVAARNQAEQALREAQAALTHVTRLTTLGEVTASFAHELNQPLAAIVNNANACLGALSTGHQDPDEMRNALGDIVADAERASAVIDRVRALAKRSAPEHVKLRLVDVVNDVLALAAAEAVARHVTIQTNVAEDLPGILGDRVQLQQVLLNLVVNAMDAMGSVDERERLLQIRGRLDTDDGRRAVTICVEDRGTGLQPEELPRLFNAFYTTKPYGMGLGLAISRSIIEAHGGRLWAESNRERGAVFSLRLPAADATAAA